MKTATVLDLRNDFARISKWLENGETVQLLKRGKPFARLVPEPKRGSFLGCMAGTAELPADIDEPVGVEWEATTAVGRKLLKLRKKFLAEGGELLDSDGIAGELQRRRG